MHKNNIIVLFGVLLTIVGIFLISNHYINEKIDIAYDMMNQKLFQNGENANEDTNPTQKEEKVELTPASGITSEDPKEEVKTYYIGYLEIPRISFYRGFTDINSPSNNIQTNIEINKSSSFPDVQGGNFIISAHSGTSYNAYFRYLYKLEEGDTAYVYYNHIKYTYIIDNIYNVPKVGTASIYRDSTKNTLTLVTCTYGDETSQTIYIAYLDKKEEY